eukprot:GHVQ01027943.1.p1 GENE.GHVQ01027943.1~~GHVQ01027943.1.p1  ORF type:complete len:156 (+),score=14.80 GHVQ01027943.1:542-1009(+)
MLHAVMLDAVVVSDNEELHSRVKAIWTNEEYRDSMLATIVKDIPRDQNPLCEEPDEEEESRSERSGVSGACVEWLGIINRKNKFAAMKVQLPDTYEWWVTYVNRVIVFVFGSIPGYKHPDDFENLLLVEQQQPFGMKCDNPQCVRLSHINYEQHA